MGASYKHTLETKCLAKNVWHQNGVRQIYYQIDRSWCFSYQRNAKKWKKCNEDKNDKFLGVCDSEEDRSEAEERAGWKSASSCSEPASRQLAMVVRAASSWSEPSRLAMVRAGQLVGGEPPDQSLWTFGLSTALIRAQTEELSHWSDGLGVGAQTADHCALGAQLLKQKVN